uniref:Uncharacterized protein n=1 Tax=Arundo donax TaxID=35708 RepID=A0A0A9BIP2_ARUDO
MMDIAFVTKFLSLITRLLTMGVCPLPMAQSLATNIHQRLIYSLATHLC